MGPADIRVEALASGISQGTELLVLRGQAPENLPLDLPTLRGSYQLPIKFGYASVGRVVARGNGVENLDVGQLVFVHHPHQTQYVVPAGTAIPIDPQTDPAVGTILANLETAVNVVLDAAPRLGDRVAVFGQGVVGLLITQLLKLTGVERIVAIDPSSSRLELARNAGAEVYTSYAEALDDGILGIDAVRADVAIECSGNPKALDDAIATVGMEGTVVVASWYGSKPVSLNLGDSFHRKRLRLVSSQVGNINPCLMPRWSYSRRMEVAKAMLQRLDLEPLVTQRVHFEKAPELYQLLMTEPSATVHATLIY